MTYKSILLNVDIDGPIEPIAKVGIDLAKRFGARLIGCCAADAPLPVTMAPEGAELAAELWQQSKQEILRRCKDLQGQFDSLAGGTVVTEWRRAVDKPNHAVALNARAADLVLTTASQGVLTGDSYRAADPATVVLRAGRPVIVVAHGSEHLPARKIVVAWKDTREARRALADAMPLMLTANEVILATIDPRPTDWIEAGIKDAAGFLLHHGVKARTEVLKAVDAQGTLSDFVCSVKADLIVSGAYGHSRAREWVFGGMTRSLLDDVWLSRFMSS
ncbi:universal stress protein [Mesorhizobium sp. ES1-4]|uniref:universal stress protein n=1 Tax=Mesorhizobium sp. ES1-4 TaxID=2876627 RepID=UPI001CCFEF88|nr:universal stress protein [Mesorhizobium sp. ES1-4]MBZ9798487.1 universal stress protein [Mesorhizobium sp. ES1-4]